MKSENIDILIDLIEKKQENEKMYENLKNMNNVQKTTILETINAYSGLIIMLGGLILAMVSGYWYLKDTVYSVVNQQKTFLMQVENIEKKLNKIDEKLEDFKEKYYTKAFSRGSQDVE